MKWFLLSSACSLFSLCSALPALSPVRRDVWSPAITWPTNTTVWVAGGTYNVTWDTSSNPGDAIPVGEVILRHFSYDTGAIILAENFLLATGMVNVTVPVDTKHDTDYIVNLFGDSGDWSPEFTIVRRHHDLSLMTDAGT